MEFRDSLIHNPAFIYLYTEHLKGAVNHVLLPEVISVIVDYLLGAELPEPVVLLWDGDKVEGIFSSRRKAEGYLNRIPEIHGDYLRSYCDEFKSHETPWSFFREHIKDYIIVQAPTIDIYEPIYVMMNDGYEINKSINNNYLTNSLKVFTNENTYWHEDHITQEWIERCTFAVNVPKRVLSAERRVLCLGP
jgi:hypothetical protein